MAKEVSTTMRSRRVMYDDYTDGFYVETRVEALQRQSENRASETEVLNKSQEARFEVAQRQIEAAKRIFERKFLAEANQHKQNLRERIAYKQILDDLPRPDGSLESGSNPRVRVLNSYSRLELQALVEARIKEGSPSSIRRKAAHKLLTHRKPVEVFNRVRSTTSLLQSARRKRHRHSSVSAEGGREYTPRQSNVQLILPPISMSMRNVRAVSSDAGLTSADKPNVTQQADLSLPSVFLTQNGNS